MHKVLLISVKPEYAFKIINGSKTIELRKSKPKVKEGDLVLIYCTRPMKAIVGFAKVKELLIEEPSAFWSKHKSKLGIKKVDYFEYFNEKDQAIGIVLSNVKELEESFDLDNIKFIHPNFQPPQTFQYFSFKEVIKSYHHIVNLEFAF